MYDQNYLEGESKGTGIPRKSIREFEKANGNCCNTLTWVSMYPLQSSSSKHDGPEHLPIARLYLHIILNHFKPGLPWPPFWSCTLQLHIHAFPHPISAHPIPHLCTRFLFSQKRFHLTIHTSVLSGIDGLDCVRAPSLAMSHFNTSCRKRFTSHRLHTGAYVNAVTYLLTYLPFLLGLYSLKSSAPGSSISEGTQRFLSHHSCGICFLPTSDLSTMNINSSGRDLKLTICNSPHYAPEDLCNQCDIYYYY